MAEEIEALARSAASGEGDAAHELAERAKYDPSAVRPWQGDLLRSGVLYPPTLYLGASAAVLDELIAAVDRGFPGDGLRLNHALLALANADGDQVEAAFRRWMHRPPPGAHYLHVPVADYTVEGGWVLNPGGGRRFLCGSIAYSLEKVDDVDRPGSSETCPFCSSPLWVVVDFDFADPRVSAALAHTGWEGKLRVTTCQFCSCYGELFSEVGPDGSSVWSALTQRPSYLPPARAETPSQPAFAVGDIRPSPYLASAWKRGGSTMGGFPEWIQDARYMRCPKCGQFMDHVALVGGWDIFTLGDGAYYVGLHSACRLAGVTYQQS